MHRGRIGTKFWPRVSVRLAPASRLSERGLLHRAAAGSHSIIATARARIISKYTPILVSVSSRPLWQGEPPTHSPTHPDTHKHRRARAHRPRTAQHSSPFGAPGLLVRRAQLYRHHAGHLLYIYPSFRNTQALNTYSCSLVSRAQVQRHHLRIRSNVVGYPPKVLRATQ